MNGGIEREEKRREEIRRTRVGVEKANIFETQLDGNVRWIDWIDVALREEKGGRREGEEEFVSRPILVHLQRFLRQFDRSVDERSEQ